MTEEHRALLDKTMQGDASCRARTRAHSLGLRAQGMALPDIAKASQVQRVPVSAWSKHWERHGAQSVPDHPPSGTPPPLTPDAQALAQPSLKAAPRSRQQVAERFANTTEKRRSLSSLTRLTNKARLRWQRVRKSCKRLRDPEACANGKRALAALQPQEDQGKIALAYCNESGCARDSSMP